MIIVATKTGCRIFDNGRDDARELEGRHVWVLAPEPGRGCLAVVDEREVWRRSADGRWAHVATAAQALESLASVAGTVYAGLMTEPTLLRTAASGFERVQGFDNVPGRSEWYAGGPPLSVRSLAGATHDGTVILVGVHVGGIPRSTDGGRSWASTVPIDHDVHEVRVHASKPLAAAAAAVGLLVSRDAGASWDVVTEGLDETYSLAVGFVDDQILFSVQDGPFAQRSQMWRWPLSGGRAEQLRDGLPEWLDGKIDTARLAVASGQTALIDGAGNLWWSAARATAWTRLARRIENAYSVLIV